MTSFHVFASELFDERRLADTCEPNGAVTMPLADLMDDLGLGEKVIRFARCL